MIIMRAGIQPSSTHHETRLPVGTPSGSDVTATAVDSLGGPVSYWADEGDDDATMQESDHTALDGADNAMEMGELELQEKK